VKRAFAEINLEQIKNNFLSFKNRVSPQTRLMAVVKADAYGLGAIAVSETCLAYGATFLGVAWAGEAKEIREAGITAPILILSEPPFDATRELVEMQVTQTVFSEEYIDKLEKDLKNLKQKLKVHLKIDTGMGRIGTSAKKAFSLIEKIEKSEYLVLEGVFTHFACADEKNNPYTAIQIKIFNEIVLQIKQKIKRPLIFHAANTAGVENFPESQFDMVRVGIGLYRQALGFQGFQGQ
jgi:alanine racemase